MDEHHIPGLHITLAVFLSLFTLLEDKSHKLDIEMTALTTPLLGDTASFVDFLRLLSRKRGPHMKKRRQLKVILSGLNNAHLETSNAATDPQILAVANLINDRKRRIPVIVSNYVTKKVPVINFIITNKEKVTDHHHHS